MFLILSKYMDGEIKEVLGYSDADEKEVEKIVKKLNLTVAKGDGFTYNYIGCEHIDNILRD